MKTLVFLLLFLPLTIFGQGNVVLVDTVKVEVLCSVDRSNNNPTFIHLYLHDADVSEDGVFKVKLLRIEERTYYHDPRLGKKTNSLKVLGYLWPDKTKFTKQAKIWQVERSLND